MKVTRWQEAQRVENPHGVDARVLYDTEHAQIVLITLEPGQRLKKHITPVDVAFFVLEGRGVVEIGDEKREVEAGALVESPARIPHCWYNESGERVRFLVIKVPRPEEPTRVL